MTFYGQRRSHCFVWVSLAAALLYNGPANSDRDIETAPARSDVEAALAYPDVASSDLEANFALADSDLPLPFLESSLNPSDECLGSDDCIDQYLWSIYQRTRKVDTIKVPERIKVTVMK
jgi:hypothetical protein